MKNYLKMIPVVAGLVFATFASTGEAVAASSEDATAVGYCQGNENRICGTTAQGTTVYGRWKEGSANQN